MNRVSTNLMNDNMQYFTGMRQSQLNDANSRLASQNRILNLRDDPSSAAHAARYDSQITRVERYSDNIQTSINTYRTTEGHMQQALDVLQEVRQLAVFGANASVGPDELKTMARSVDEMLNHLVMASNAVDGDGSAVFAGQRTRNTPFRAVQGTVPGGDRTMITSVDYLGDIGERRTEIADGQYVSLNFPGNQVFWAENQNLIAARDSREWVAAQDSAISIDGVSIDIRQGDNIHALVAKINDSDAAVKAKLDPVTSGLVLETTMPHQIWLRDEQGSTLQTLGVIDNADTPPPHNVARDVSKSGGSMFDMLISLRNNLLSGNQLAVGGNALGGIDTAIDNLLGRMGELGAKTARMDLAYKRNEKQIPDLEARLSIETDIDMTKAITDLKVLELTHEAALSATARILKPSLLDFLR